MSPTFWLPLGLALVWACVTPRPAAAEDVNVANCINEDLAPAERVIACRTAAEDGDALALAILGLMYADGRGVPQDDTEAAVWYRHAAEQGYALAQAILGSMYADGQGVPQDDVEAVVWFRRAAEQGDAFAQAKLGFMYEAGRGVPQDDVEAVVWFRRAAEQGNAGAQSMLGVMYAAGRGVPQDYTLAHMWCNLAGIDTTVGEGAREVRDKVAAQMTPAQIAQAQRLAREWMAAHQAGAQ